MEVEIISKQHIKPSSPTPHHLRTYKLSLLDQCIPLIHVSIVFYYPIDNQNPIKKDTLSIEEKLQVLKKSLSQTLSRFYTFAGKIKDSFSIDCNDEGVYYVEARVKCNLSEFLSQPDLSLVHQFLPCNPSWKESNVGDNVVMVQVNVFDCGGIAIGAYVSHMLGDGVGFSTFFEEWGATARGCCDYAMSPDFTTAQTRFPQNDSFPKGLSVMPMFNPFFKTGKSVTRRFVFDASALAILKDKSKSSWVQNPSSVEAVSALIWKCIMAACKAKSGIQKPSLITHAVDLRKREVPPLSDYLMGNYIGVALAQCTAQTGTDTELGNLVRAVRESTANINGEFLKNLEGDQGFHNFCEGLKEIGGVFSRAAISNKGAEYVMFTSWCSFGFYEVDFGWGTPIWVTNSGPREEEASVVVNFVCLMKNKCGDSIEALVILEEQDMAILECDKELLTYAP